MGMNLTVALHHRAEMLGPMLCDYANGKMKGGAFNTGAVGGVIEYSDQDRRQLVRWLEKLTNPSRAMLNQIAKRAECLTLNNDTGMRTTVSDGKLSLSLNVGLHGKDNLSTIAFMLASVISADLAEHLRKCPHCEQWFFAIKESGKGGKLPKYCSYQHANAARQKRYRESMQ